VLGLFRLRLLLRQKKKVNVTLKDEANLLNEIVVSASRTPERVLESPVTIERMGIADIKKSASATFMTLENLKEVQMNTSSLSFKSINTRGFATVANTRFMQLVDGMDISFVELCSWEYDWGVKDVQSVCFQEHLLLYTGQMHLMVF
jgi:hypothetical protein